MFNLLAIIGIFGFIIFIVLGFISIFKKDGQTKKRFGIAAGLFVLFLIGAINSSSPDTETSDTKTEEVKEEETKKIEKEEVKKEPSTVAEVQAAITKGMTNKDFKKAKEEALNVEHPKSISIGHGNTGYVLEATDGIVVATTDGTKILDVLTFQTIEEVNQYEKDSLAKADAEEKEIAKKEFEESKTNVSGSGDTATDGFKLTEGFAIFDGTHTGSSNFAVKLQDEGGNNLELLVNDIGNYKGKTFAMIPANGSYYLDVKAGGSWKFEISQKPPLEIQDAPTTLQGKGDDVVFFNATSGNYKFSFTHQGESNFAVKLNGTGLMVNEIGTYNGSTRQRLSTDGYYLLQIMADGNWSVKIEK